MGTPDDTVRVLHVDDDVAFADLAATFLERESDRIEVVTEHDAAAGLERLSGADVDCVVSDYDMPGRDGVEFLEAVREAHGDLPFVLFTGKGSEEVASEAISKGVTDYVQKRGGTDQYALLAKRVENSVSRRRVERRLEASEQRYRTLLDEAPVPMLVYGTDGQVRYANDAAVAFLGADSEADLLGTHTTDFSPTEEPDEAIEARLERVVEGGEPVPPREQPVVGLDGTRRRAIVGSAPTRFEGDPAVQTVAYDVTERRQREHVLAELNAVAADMDDCEAAEAVYERTVAAAEHVLEFDQCAVSVETDGVLSVVARSEGVPEGGTAEMAVGEGIVGETYRTGEPFLLDDVQESAAANPQGPYRACVSVPIGDHGVLQAVASAASAFDEDDLEFVELLAAHAAGALDRIEAAQTRETFSTAMKASIDGLALLDDEGRYTFVNRAHAAVYGYDDPDEMVGETWRVCYGDAETERFEREVLPVLEREGSWRGVAVGRRRDGSTFQQELSLTALDDGGLVCVVRDVTERVERERELERQNERLEELAGIVSHDLRNPLNSAIGRVELARERYDDADLDAAARAHDRMEALVEDLLALAREGHAVEDPDAVPLAGATREAWDGVDGPGDLAVETDRTVAADEGRLVRLLENLFRNSVEHGGARGDGVTVTVGTTDDGFYVADDGPGVPPDEREAVFEPGVTTARRGTGLGLRIVERVANAHGWSVSLTGSESGGARVEVAGVEFRD